uniref:Coiled-coil domain-containing protein 57 n=1 Tax=Arion vulgaris TaxID=1028688 RepID=A0A0B7B4I3_9EUPU
MDKADSVSWKTLADEKEKEWRGILESRIEALEKGCKEKDNQLMSEKTKFNELKEHFKYNLKLLEERDKELEKYDVSYSELQVALNSKNAEISELKIHLDDLKNVIKREEKIEEELRANYQRRLREKQSEVDAYKSSKDGEIQDERKDYEEFRRNLQLQLLNVQNELDTQKSELTIGFENALKKREHEFRVQFDELNTKAMEHELKAKILEKELELTRDSSDKTTAAAEEAETSQRKLEKLVKQKEWELADSTAIKDSQIAELQSKLVSCESAMKKMQEDFQRKYTEMDKLTRDRESIMERAKNGYLEKEQALQTVIQELQSKLEDAQIRERQLIWSNQDLVKEKEIQSEKFQEELNDVKERESRHIAEMSRENVTRDLELSTTLEEQRKLKIELEQRKDDLQRYRRELKVAADREEKLDKTKTQIELDWQRRCEDLERQQYDNSEELIKKLTTARNEAQALVKERDRELRNKILLVKSLHRERDQLRVLLKKHNISLDDFVKFSLDESAEEEEMNYVEDLQKQNASLKELISQMRLQMESVGQDSPKRDVKSTFGSLSAHEEELLELRKENRVLKEKVKSSRRVVSDRSHLPIIEDSEEILSQVEGNTAVKTHIIALNNNIGTLRSEKVELAVTAKKQQARIAYLENSLEEVSKQPRQRQIQIDQLTYELNSCRHRHETQVTGLKNRVSELEFLLSEARREADEYHRASLERNEELVALGNQLSALKMEMSESSPSINFGAQELYIQQLQDELTHLRKRATAIDTSDMVNINSRFASLGDNNDSADLKHKLRTAAARIVHLAKENQQLTESNNKLRAELKVAIAETKSSDLPVRSNNSEKYFEDNQNYQDIKAQNEDAKFIAAQDRLQQLEKLQYQLTRKELQFTHRFKVGSGVSSQRTTHGDYEDVPEKDSTGSQVKDLRQKNIAHSPDMKVKAGLTNIKSTSHDMDPHILGSFSSGGGDSIQKVWQMLDESSPSAGTSTPRSPRTNFPAQSQQSAQLPGMKHIRRSDGGDGFYLEGLPVPTEIKTCREQNLQNNDKTYSEKVRKLKKPKPKIRNYNVRDDSSRR